MDLSIIMPYVNEWPQIAFTYRSIANELNAPGVDIDWEIVFVDNYCAEVEAQNIRPDQGHSRILLNKVSLPIYQPIPQDMLSKAERTTGVFQSISATNRQVKYVRYDEKLSHWNAKIKGVEASSGDVLLFLDAHVVPSVGSICGMLDLYADFNEACTFHLPLTYKVTDDRRLVYKLVYNKGTGEVHYSFSPAKETNDIIEVPCMSTCGMMVSREVYDMLRGWPPELGIYGGGENFLNFTSAIMGVRKYIYSPGTLYHHGARRSYRWNHLDYTRNRMIATYMFGGLKWLSTFLQGLITNGKVDGRTGRHMVNNLLALDSLLERRDYYRSAAVTDIETYCERWLK